MDYTENTGARAAAGARYSANARNAGRTEPSKTRPKRKSAWAVFDGGDGETRVRLVGRELWALQNLIASGERGCTPIDTPGPRWSHYTWLLRGHGIDIEKITEEHGGPYWGTHARYVLRSKVYIIDEEPK